MRLRFGSSPFLLVVSGGLAAILVTLAILQYRWIGQVSAAERERVRASLNNAVSQFRGEFNRELLRVCASFQVDSETISNRNWNRIAQYYDTRLRLHSSSSVIANLFVYEIETRAPDRLLQMNFGSLQFEQVPWPSRLNPARELFSKQPLGTRRLTDVRAFAWTMFYRIPAMIHPLVAMGSPDGRRPPETNVIGHLIVELDLEFLRDEFLPDLAQRYFAGRDGFVYQVAVIGEFDSTNVVYRSHPGTPPEAFDAADARVSLLWDPRETPSRFGSNAGGRFSTAENHGRDFSSPPPFRFNRRGRPPGGFRTPVLIASDAGGRWILAVKHLEGSLDEFVDRLRRRSLLISFGILLLLAASVALLVVSTQRARRLADLHMNFAAGVSHELRTPLTVIHSAAENLADGIVKDSDAQVRRYGELIRNESRRLSEMVEQVLQFARGRSNRRLVDLRPVAVAEAIDAAISDMQESIRSEGFSVEETVDPDLPPAAADFDALRQCVRNLISNAIKYSGTSRRIVIRAAKVSLKEGDEIQISVEDFGLGIDPEDLPYVFDTFYRSKRATSVQIKGTGLGLSLTRDLMEAMGGKVTVRSAPGRGSIFTLFVPVSGPSPVRD